MTNRNRFTRSMDGVDRITINVPCRVNIDEMAALIASVLGFDLEGADSDQLATLVNEAVTSQRKALSLTKDAIIDRGLETPNYYVGDNGWDIHIAPAIKTRLLELWP